MESVEKTIPIKNQLFQVKARILTKENIGQMRRSALAMIAKSNYLEYRSKQMELINDIASVVHVFGLNSCVRTVWSMDHSFEDLSLHLGYNKPSDKLKLDPDASVIYIFWDRYSAEEHKARLSEKLNKFFDELERIANKKPFKN